MSALLRDIILGVIGLLTATIVTIKQIKEIKARKDTGLRPNPERCKEHADRILSLETKESGHSKEIGMVQASIDMVGRDVKTLIDMHLKER
jgi:hypothetical protein